jgi:predicted Holliday junction resolvase-like endonuclease
MNDAVDLKQIPNLEQVLTLTLVPLLFVTIFLVIVIFLLWFKVKMLQQRVASLEADLRLLVKSR